MKATKSLRRRWQSVSSGQLGSTMPKATMPFEQSRKALLTRMSAKAGNQSTEKTIQFRNDDVPSFLQKLEHFEKESRKAKLVAR